MVESRSPNGPLPALCELLLGSVAVHVVHPDFGERVAELGAVCGTYRAGEAHLSKVHWKKSFNETIFFIIVVLIKFKFVPTCKPLWPRNRPTRHRIRNPTLRRGRFASYPKSNIS